jgi:hypothetical protein
MYTIQEYEEIATSVIKSNIINDGQQLIYFKQDEKQVIIQTSTETYIFEKSDDIYKLAYLKTRDKLFSNYQGKNEYIY